MNPNPCLTCGVCCTLFRVSFFWREADDQTPGGVPLELTEDLTPMYRVMKGTNQQNPRCVCLQGTLKQSVGCSIHPRRPTPCREFEASWANGRPNERCDRARATYGLPPLTPQDWAPPDQPDEPLDPAA